MIGAGAAIMPILVAISALGGLSCHIMTSSRLCFVGARQVGHSKETFKETFFIFFLKKYFQGHIPDSLSLVTLKSYTPTPALVFLVSICFQKKSSSY